MLAKTTSLLILLGVCFQSSLSSLIRNEQGSLELQNKVVPSQYFFNYASILWIHVPFIVWSLGIIFVPALYIFAFLFKMPRYSKGEVHGPGELIQESLDMSPPNGEEIENEGALKSQERRLNSKKIDLDFSRDKRTNRKNRKKEARNELMENKSDQGGIFGVGRTIMSMFLGGGPCIKRVGCQVYQGALPWLFGWMDNWWGNNYLYKKFKSSRMAREIKEHGRTMNCGGYGNCIGLGIPDFFEIFMRQD